MSQKTLALPLCLLLLACAACAQKGGAANTQPAAATPAPKYEPPPQSATCRMLTAEDLREVQGEAPQESQGSEHAVGGLSMSQCFYRMPTFSRSVNVELVRAAEGSSPEALKEFWRQRFHPKAVEERERERERKEEAEREREREKKQESERGQVREGGHKEEERAEEESKPRRVDGLGEEAFWSGNQINSSLNVLAKNAVVRVSIGGPEDQTEKIKKASALARKMLKQL